MTLIQIKPNLLITEAVAEELILDSYVMHRHHQLCTNCDCGEEFSLMYEVWVHPTKTQTTGYRQLKRVLLPFKQDLDVSVVELPEQKVPLCTECVDKHTPQGATVFPACSPARWAETLQRKYTPEPQPRTSTKIEPTLDQL